MPNANSPIIEVFADVWCPFAHVGLRAVAAQRRLRGRDDIPMIVRAWPLERVNNAPMNPEKTADHIHHLREQVVPELFAGFSAATFPTTTIPALAAVARAYRHGVHAGEQMSFAVRDALFEEGLDVSDDRVLALLAARVGTEMPDDHDIETVLADWNEGQQRGVIGSPHFFCGDVQAFCPSLDISRDPEHGMRILIDKSGIENFLDRAIGPVRP